MQSWTFLLIALCASSSAAQVSNEQLDQIKTGIDGTGSLAFQRLTSSGQFIGCSVEYGVVLRDWKAKRGEPVKYFGSVVSFYDKGKEFSVVVKLKAVDIQVPPNGQLKTAEFDPADASLAVSNRTYTSAMAYARFRCETGGLCLAWALKDANEVRNYLDALSRRVLQINVTSVMGASIFRLTYRVSSQPKKPPLSLISSPAAIWNTFAIWSIKTEYGMSLRSPCASRA